MKLFIFIMFLGCGMLSTVDLLLNQSEKMRNATEPGPQTLYAVRMRQNPARAPCIVGRGRSLQQ